jgi:hypothetical protein
VAITRKTLVDAVMTRLDTVTNAVGWLGEPDTPLPLLGDGRTVGPHWVLYPSPGTPTDELDLADTVIDLDWLFQVTCVAGDPMDLLPLVGRVDAALYRWRPTIEGVTTGAFRPPSGFDPGQMRVDDSVTPHRFYLPMQYRCIVSAT